MELEKKIELPEKEFEGNNGLDSGPDLHTGQALRQVDNSERPDETSPGNGANFRRSSANTAMRAANWPSPA